MSLSVKLFIRKVGSGEEEVRRFAVDEDVSTCYDYLTAKIRATVPSASDAAIKLFWKDEDGELISMSSDEELIDALDHVQDGVLKLYVQLGVRPPANVVPEFQCHQVFDMLSRLLTGTANNGCAQGRDGCCTGRSNETGHNAAKSDDMETDKDTHASDEQQQHLRLLIVNAANAFLEPLGFRMVDQRDQSDGEEPAAGARMTSSESDGRDATANHMPGPAAATGSSDNQASSTPMGTASSQHSPDGATNPLRGRVNELLTALGFDADVGCWLTGLIEHHAGRLEQDLMAGSRASPASAGSAATF